MSFSLAGAESMPVGYSMHGHELSPLPQGEVAKSLIYLRRLDILRTRQTYDLNRLTWACGIESTCRPLICHRHKAAAHLLRRVFMKFRGRPRRPEKTDLEAKLREFQRFFNEHRTHAGLGGRLPDSGGPAPPINFASYRWQKHCRGLYQTPIAA